MSRRRKRAESGGWLQTLLGAALLMVVGFGVGLVAGAALQDPRLVLRHVAGEGTEVALPGGDEVPAASLREREPPIEAPAASEVPLGAGALAREPKVAAVVKQPAAPAVAPAPAAPAREAPSREGWAIQVGAFDEIGAARALIARLDGALPAGQEVAAYVAPGRGAPWRVRVGPFPTRELADARADRLQRSLGLPTWVLAEEGR